MGRVSSPSGPFISIAVVGVSCFLLRAFVLGRSKKRRETSDGIAMGSLPTRECLGREVVNCRDCGI